MTLPDFSENLIIIPSSLLTALVEKPGRYSWYQSHLTLTVTEGRASMGTLACDSITEAGLSAYWCRSTGRNGDRVV